jgi:hypothetical protein
MRIMIDGLQKEQLLTRLIQADAFLFIHYLLNVSYQVLMGVSEESRKLCMVVFSLLLEDSVICQSLHNESKKMKMKMDGREEVVSCMAICLLDLCRISLSRPLKSSLTLDTYT